jgi:nitrile hydratase
LWEFGTKIPTEVEVRVHESTADLRYLVLPQRPAGTEHLTEDELASLVKRDSMVGITVIQEFSA